MKSVLKKALNDYRYHAKRMDNYFSESTLIEQIVWVITCFGLVYGSYYQIKLMLSLNFIILSVLVSLDAYKELNELIYCYKDYIKPNIFYNNSFNSLFKHSFVVSIFLCFKFIKPIFKFLVSLWFFCMMSIGMFDFLFGFNPLRELALANNDIQTYEQAWYHIKNPMKYANLTHHSYIEDLLQEVKQNEQLIKMLQKQLEEGLKK